MNRTSFGLVFCFTASVLNVGGASATPEPAARKSEDSLQKAARLVLQVKSTRACGKESDEEWNQAFRAVRQCIGEGRKKGGAALADALILEDDLLFTGNNLDTLKYSEALTIRERIFGSESPKVAEVLNKLGAKYGYSGKIAEAQQVFNRSIAIMKKENGSGMLALAESMNIAARHRMTSLEGDVNRLYLKALRAMEKQPHPDRLAIAIMWDTLAVSNSSDKLSFPDALEYSNKAISVAKDACPADKLSAFLSTRGDVNYNARQFDAAVACYKQALTLNQKERPNCISDIANLQRRIASAYSSDRRYKEAEPYVLASLNTWKHGAPNVSVLNAYNQVVSFYSSCGNLADQAKYLEESLVYERKWHASSTHGVEALGKLYVEMGLFAKAEPYLLTWLKSREGGTDSDCLEVLVLLGKTKTRLGKLKEADVYFSRAKTAYGNDPPMSFREDYLQYLVAAKELIKAAALKAEIEKLKIEEAVICRGCGGG